MDLYKNIMNRDLYRMLPIDESERVSRDSIYSGFFTLGSMRPDILPVEISFDHFMDCIKYDGCDVSTKLKHIKIYDEAIVETREEAMLRFQMLKYLNNQRNCLFTFYLSDSTMPAYISFMESVGWKHEKRTRLVLNLDRNYTGNNIPIECAKGKVIIEPEKLICFSDKTLSLLPGKVDSTILSDTMKLKKFVHDYLVKLHDKYKTVSLTDFDKAYIAFHYLFDNKKQNNINFSPMGIEYADDRVHYSKKGVAKLKPSETRWESRAAGTLEHGSGVCTGQAKLFRTLICNPEIDITADTVCGKTSTGGIHCWCEFVIDEKLYQCCTTGGGLFSDLNRKGYVPFNGLYFPELYPHASLNSFEINRVAKHVKELRK